MDSYTHLLSPIKIGSLKVKNRVCFAPMATHLADRSGEPSDSGVRWYAAKAKGGAGLIMPEAAYVNKTGRRGPFRLSLHEDSRIEGNKKIVDAVHKEGSHIFAQLHHGGKTAPPEGTGEYPVGPSVIQYSVRHDIPWVGVVTRQLAKADIESLVEDFVLAAKRAYASGYDGVCVHAAHGYLLSSFVSPTTNLRDDEYGGDVSGRTRIVREIIQGIRQVTVSDYPVTVRLNVIEGVPWGYKEDYALEVAQILEKAGADFIDFSAGITECFEYQVQPRWFEEGCLVPYVKKIKGQIHAPVGVAGRIKHPAMAEEIIKNGHADMVSVGRSFIADPDWLNKYVENRQDEVNQCIGCNNCFEQILASAPISCTVNPLAGKDFSEEDITNAPKRKKVVVAGGGVAGLSFVKWAAKRGHEVELYEKDNELGGQLKLAAAIPDSSELMFAASDLKQQIDKLPVKIVLGKAVTPKLVNEIKPDVLVMATGAVPKNETLIGENLPNVADAFKVLSGEVTPGKNVIVLGGGLIGASVAEFLAEKGHSVTIVKRSVAISPDAQITSRRMHTLRLAANNVRVVVKAQVQRITSKGVLIRWEEMNSEQEFISCDTVVLARGLCPELELLKDIDSLDLEIYRIGDSVKPRNIYAAIKDGFDLAMQI
jgi:2,4-dienoyl-CoA reductase-like NADH-dependent reductase (Old Yellow Enzyme family)/thioredoxin reductase